MAVTDDDRRAFITEQVSSDLQYVLQEADISLRKQYEITQHYRNLRVFAAIADDKAELRTALRAVSGWMQQQMLPLERKWQEW